MDKLKDASKEVEINFSLLDAHCLSFLSFHGIYLNSDSQQQEPDSNLLLIQLIYQYISEGNMKEVMNILPTEAKQDTFLYSKIQKQYLIEMIRNKEVENALKYLRNNENLIRNDESFKNYLLLLIYSKSETLPEELLVDFDLKKRETLAKHVQSNLYFLFKIQEPNLSLLMRYLILIHNMWMALKRQETFLNEIKQFEESERIEIDEFEEPLEIPNDDDQSKIYILAKTVGISPDEATQSLLLNQWDMQKALLFELSRIPFNYKLLGDFCLEYLDYRGLLKDKDQFRNVDWENITQEVHEKAEKLKTIQNRLANYNELSMEMHSIVEEILSICPDMDQQAPSLLFYLKRLEFLEALHQKDTIRALEISKKDLTELSNQNPSLKNEFREISLYLIYPLSPVQKWNASELAGPVYSFLSRYLNIIEPRLVYYLKVLLKIHELWFHLQFQKDFFQDLFHIPELKQKSLSQNEEEEQEIVNAIEIFDAKEIVRLEKEADEEELNEEDILTVQDILACTRMEAIGLLLENEGRISEALATIFDQ